MTGAHRMHELIPGWEVEVTSIELPGAEGSLTCYLRTVPPWCEVADPSEVERVHVISAWQGEDRAEVSADHKALLEKLCLRALHELPELKSEEGTDAGRDSQDA